jgi:glycosyltransferase involved in cell wall biosynthesis
VDRLWFYESAQATRIGNVVVELRHLTHAYEATVDADVVHDHTMAGPFLAGLFRRRAVVTTNHGPFTDDVRGLYRCTASRVPIIAVSRHQASTAGEVPVARVIHHGIDVDRYPLGAGDGGYVLFLGRMSPDKGVREAIEVALRAGIPLVIAAKRREPAEHGYFDTQVKPFLGPDVRYVGEVGGVEKLELLGAATALLNPLRWDEPFGLCMIEALACGTPVVATRHGAVPEIVDDGVTGYVGDTETELAAALATVGELDRRACREAVERRFSARRMVAEHLSFYSDVIVDWPKWHPTPERVEPLPVSG